MDLIDTQSPRQALLSEGSYRSPSPQKSNDKSFIQPWDDEENSYEYSSSRAGKSPVQTKEKKERSNNNSPLGHAYHRNLNTDPGTPGNQVGSRDFDDTLHKLRKMSKNREEVIGHHHDRKSRKDLDSKEEDIGKTLQMQQREEELSKQQTANNIMELDNNFNRYGNSEVAGQTALNSLIYQSQHGSEIYFIDELRLYIDKDEAAECMGQGSSRGQVPTKKVSAPLVMTQSNIKTGIMKAYNMYDHVVDDYGTPNLGNKEGISSSTVVYHGGKQHSMGHISVAKSPLIQIPVDMSKSIKTMESSPMNGLDAMNMAYSYTRTDRANRGSMGNKDDLPGNKNKVKPLMFPEINPKKRHNTHTSVSVVPQPTSYDVVRDDPGSEYYGSPNKLGSQHFPSSTKGNKESVDSFKGFKAPGKGSFSVMYKRGKKIRKALELRDGSGDQPQFLPPIVDTVKSAVKSDMKMCFDSIVNGTERFEYGISKEKDARFFKEVDTTGQLKRSPLLKVIQRQVGAGNKEDNVGQGIGKKTLGHSIQKGNVRNKGSEIGNKGSLKALPMKDLWESDSKLMEKKVRQVFHLAATPTAAMVKGQQNKRM